MTTWYDKFRKDVAIGAVLATICSLAYNFSGIGKDDSDGGQRSGMKVYVDNKTGCEYLSTPSSALIPRMDASGNQICKK